MPPESNAAPAPTCAGLDIRLRNMVAHRNLKRAELNGIVETAAREVTRRSQEIDGLDAGIADLIEQRLAVMTGAHAEPTVALGPRLAPFVGRS